MQSYGELSTLSLGMIFVLHQNGIFFSFGHNARRCPVAIEADDEAAGTYTPVVSTFTPFSRIYVPPRPA